MEDARTRWSRRAFLRSSVLGAGGLALDSLLARSAQAGSASAVPHWPAKARQVILLFMAGGPSQIDLFDPKPALAGLDGQPCPEELIAGKRFAFLRGRPNVMASPYPFQRYGQSGSEFSSLLPHIAETADYWTMVRSVHTDEINHAPAQLLFHTGTGRFGRPSIGSWVSYGLGSIEDDLPTFVAMVANDEQAGAGDAMFGSAFLPAEHQGVRFRAKGDPVLYLRSPDGVDERRRARSIDAIRDLNSEHYDALGARDTPARSAQYELAFKMQASVPELSDLSQESPATLEAYGATPGDGSFASQCLLARRLVERGVRFVEVVQANWDHHTALLFAHPAQCRVIDRPIAALVRDLEQRGLLEETLVVLCGEFGRTPLAQFDGGSGVKTAPGRDHQHDAFTVLMAGGGLRRGLTYGRTNELGAEIVENPVHVNDLHATILRLLGLHHEQLDYRHAGRDFRLTDVAGRVVEDLIA